MSWARDLIQVPTLLLEVVSLLREQNSLHRELIVTQTGRPPSTRLTTPSAIFVRPPLNRTYTAEDVSVVTREMRVDQQRQEQQRAGAPWQADVPAPNTTGEQPASSRGDGDAAPTRPSAKPRPDPASPSPPRP